MFEPARLIELVLALVAVEFVALCALWVFARRGLPPRGARRQSRRRRLRPGTPRAVAEAVIGASRSADRQLVSAAAFTLGVVGGPGAAERLLELQTEADDDIRFNAAVGLARLGRTEAFSTLAEMLALPDVAAAADDPEAQSARYKRALVVVNALRATALLADAGAGEPPADVVRRVVALADDPVSDVRTAAAALGRKFKRLSPDAAP